jgi:hypothetical protein
MSIKQTTPDTFHVGITMAGAGSAGCYIGGVMDYMFEILDLWEKAKNGVCSEFVGMEDYIPRHKVVIDVMGGTSGGGMTTAMSAIYALNGIIKPVTDSQNVGKFRNNIFYDSWVMLDDDPEANGRKTLAKAFDADDLSENKFVSLLNSRLIDDIADGAFRVTGDIKVRTDALPSYISKDLDLLQSHTMLRGIPLSIDFATPIGEVKGVSDIPCHNTFEHFTMAHYKLNYGVAPNADDYLWLNPYQEPYVSTMKLTTKSTGAFPIGLKFREIDNKSFSDTYLQHLTERIIFDRFGRKHKAAINWNNFPSNFNFVTIDGGAIDNEPFGEVLGILKLRYNNCFHNGYPKYAVVMIDPFPDVIDRNNKYKAPDDLFSVVPAIIDTLHEQSKVKRADVVEAAERNYYRGEIFPRRWIGKDLKDEFPIGSGAVSAFGGFLDINFRHYDFFLGRDNARNYFRYYFSFEYSPHEDPEKHVVHPIHAAWTDKMIETFKVTGKDGKTYLPIIPDLNILNETKSGQKRSPFEYSISSRPQFEPTSLFELRAHMEQRFEKILDVCKARLVTKEKETQNEKTADWMDKYYHVTWWDVFKGWMIKKSFNIIFFLTKAGLARNLTEMAVRWVLTDLEKRGFLKDVP